MLIRFIHLLPIATVHSFFCWGKRLHYRNISKFTHSTQIDWTVPVFGDINHAAITSLQCLLVYMHKSVNGIYVHLGVEMQSHRITKGTSLPGSAKLFPKVVVPIYTLTRKE